jgi:hypothetical protein
MPYYLSSANFFTKMLIKIARQMYRVLISLGFLLSYGLEIVFVHTVDALVYHTRVVDPD